jgi:tRNA 2-thiocytidine biosynthesis protein TtcA
MPSIISNLQFSISKKVGQAIADYQMLQDGDKVLVAVSGGKDSLSLLRLLKYRQGFIPIKFEILAVFIDSGIPDFPVKTLVEFFEREEIPYKIKKVDILKGKRWEDINCFLCARRRRKALFDLADKLKFNKIALGHHLDDIAETILLNLFYHGEIGAMCPKQELFKGKLTLIRPLAYVPEDLLRRLAKQGGYDTVDKFRCPNSDKSKRELMTKIIALVGEHNPHVKKNIVAALQNIKKEYLP